MALAHKLRGSTRSFDRLFDRQRVVSCKSLDLILRTMSDFAIHPTANIIGEADSDVVKDAKHRLHRREQSSRP